MTKRAGLVGWVGLGLLFSCSSSEPPSPASSSLASSPQAAAFLTSLRSRFVLPPVAVPRRPKGLPSDLSPPSPEPGRLFLHGSSEGFDRSGDRLSPRLRIASSVKRPASVTLPVRASGGFEVKDTTSGLRLAVKLQGTTEAEAEEAEGNVVYRGGYRGQGAVVHRPHAEGTEDFVLLEHELEEHALVYEVDVRGVAGLRLTSNVLEFLNAAGDPRLRMTAPLAVDAEGKTLGLRLSVKGCAVDEKEALPWGREVVSPGAERCEVRVAWEGATYPLVVDPGFTTSGSLAIGRYAHTATSLPKSRILVIGGTNAFDATNCPNESCKPAEVWQEGSFSMSDTLAKGRYNHTASLLSGNRVLVVGGADSASKSSEIWDNGSFKNAGIPIIGRYLHRATVLPPDRVLITGGYVDTPTTSCPGNGCKTAEIWQEYSFFDAGNMIVGRSGHTATPLSLDRVVVIGGYNTADQEACPNKICKTAEMWEGNNFTSAGELVSGRAFHEANLLPDNKILLVGGETSTNDTVDCPDYVCKRAVLWQNNQFFDDGIMALGRYYHTASSLSADRILVVGGHQNTNCPGGFCDAAELWQNGKFSQMGVLSFRRDNHTANVLEDDRVVVVGGRCEGGPCKQTEVWSSSCTGSGDCGLEAYCNKLTGQCENLIPLGIACIDAFQCESKFCVDGVCCDAPCQGQCEFCARPGALGQCKPTPAGQQPGGSRVQCNTSTDPECHGACDGGDPSSCKFPGTATLCSSTSCNNNTLQPFVCDGQGTCKAQPSQDCGTFACDPKASSCKTSCASNDDCAAGATCNKATAQCSLGEALCADDFTAKTTSGTLVPCKGRCLAGQCQESCGGPADCAKGYSCQNNTCVQDSNGVGGQGGAAGASAGGSGAPAASTAGASEEGGCGCSTPGQRMPARGLVAVVALGLALSRRRGRAPLKPQRVPHQTLS